jgi:hypothetical protein
MKVHLNWAWTFFKIEPEERFFSVALVAIATEEKKSE